MHHTYMVVWGVTLEGAVTGHLHDQGDSNVKPMFSLVVIRLFAGPYSLMRI